MIVTRRSILACVSASASAAVLPRIASAAAPESLAPIVRKVPSTGEAMPAVGIGANAFDVGTAAELEPLREVVREMPSLGGRLIDSARGYGRSEAVLGQLIEELRNRERLFIATKPVSAPQAAARIDRALIDESFASLRVPVIDLMQVHSQVRFDDVLPLLLEYRQEKRIRYIGATTAATRQHAEFLEVMRKAPLDFVQVDYSIANRDSARDLLPLAQERGMAVINNMPFGGRNGSLFPKLAGRKLPDWAAEFDATTWAQFMLKYNLSHPAITVAIPGTTTLAHLRDNQAGGRGRLPDAAMRRRMEQYWDAL